MVELLKTEIDQRTAKCNDLFGRLQSVMKENDDLKNEIARLRPPKVDI